MSPLLDVSPAFHAHFPPRQPQPPWPHLAVAKRATRYLSSWTNSNFRDPTGPIRFFPIQVVRTLTASLTRAVSHVHAQSYVNEEKFRSEFGEPDTGDITRVDGKPLSQDFTLTDTGDVLPSDFREAFAPATEPPLAKDCHAHIPNRAPETLFEPDSSLSYPSDIGP
ncbi:hypothetical protein B0T10DRAFT_461484 [Thelonectria olida]|uniref:Uncharacterized protein n=1 Tax=Thelonectria olida TaxID=1576542 RepID=A0A9P8W0K8_9HYPO|nr:hypothetical protein B0T10DRAFT_461484 [Thelonectria olida]